MTDILLTLLVDPEQRQSLNFEQGAVPSEGKLHATNGKCYALRSGIPRLLEVKDVGQGQTQDAFGFKWAKRDTYDSAAFKKITLEWYVKKYGFASGEAWAEFYASRDRILDVGCGSAFSAALWLDTPQWRAGKAHYIGADISTAVDVAQERLMHVPRLSFVQADALALPFSDGTFDTVFSEGVLHHTPSTRSALLSAARVVKPGGEFHFYVYRKKAPLREFTDDYIRERISGMSNDEAWDAMRSLTRFGQVLSELKATIEVPEDVEVLGIKAGRYDVQRLIYNAIAKLYWNENISLEESTHVNFDWYRPAYAHRQTADEVRAWCVEGNLRVDWLFEDESGVTVKAVKHG